MLESIRSPRDLDSLSEMQLRSLAEEIRARICEVVRKNGGHLASNLGTVELTLALHRAYDVPRDKIVWDVGHQAYAHKILTGRNDRFDTIRREGGLSGFPNIFESECDAFGAGHSSTSVSAALGLARARDLQGGLWDVVAVVGDGALGGGMVYEALNDLGHHRTPMVVVLNDNDMSISRNVGAMSQHLNRMRTGLRYIRLKETVQRRLIGGPKGGFALYRLLERVKDALRAFFVRDGFFGSLGVTYIGPVDGHNLTEMTNTLRRAKSLRRPVLVHVVTKKGKGDRYAEGAPEAYHGVPAPGQSRLLPAAETVGKTLCRMAGEDLSLVGITAAMPSGTGMAIWQREMPGRVFDVGIAEEHAATFAAGLARGGMRPYLCLYSTFAQRAADQFWHDIALQGLPVVTLLDHAGLVGEDGMTHHGLLDIAWLRALPGIHLLAPDSAASLEAMLRWSRTSERPVFLRYPARLPEAIGDGAPSWPFGPRKLRGGEDALLIAVGGMALGALSAAALLQAQGVSCAVYSVQNLMVYPECLPSLPAVFAEEGVRAGSFAEWAAAAHPAPHTVLAVEADRVPHASPDRQLRMCGLDPAGIAAAALRLLGREGAPGEG